MADKSMDTRVDGGCDGPPAVLQFRLRTLLLVVAATSATLALMVRLGPFWSLGLLLLLALVAGHVLGNFVGHRLRDAAPLRPTMLRPAAMRPRRTKTSVGRGTVGRDVEPPRLSRRGRIGRVPFVFALAGAFGGAFAARVVFSGLWADMSLSDSLLGISSLAVIGALCGFVASSFVSVGGWPAIRFFFQRVEPAERFRQ